MRWTHKHVRKVAYTLIALIFALPKIGFWTAIALVIALEVGLRKGFFSKWCVAIKDDRPAAKIKELEAAPDKDAWVQQEAADRSGTAMVDGLLYLYGPTLLLIIATIIGTSGLIPDSLSQQVPPEMLKKTMSTTSGWVIFLVSAWMISSYLGRYKKTAKKLKEIASESTVALYQKLSGPMKNSAHILWGVSLALYFICSKSGVTPYICSFFLLLPTLWPIVYFTSYLKAKKSQS